MDIKFLYYNTIRLTANKTRLEDSLSGIRVSRVFIPIVIGIGVVSYLLWKQFDYDSFQKLIWDRWTISWILGGIGFFVIRHFAYANRLRILSDGKFGWRKSIELIFIWEFASAVSPTSLGGSAVALILLAKEQIKAAKTVTIVLYSVVLDTLFFIISLPLLYLVLGPRVIRPGMSSLTDIDGFGITFIIVFFVMFAYGFIFFYGLFYRPQQISKFLMFLSKIKWLKRFKDSLAKTAEDVIISSAELKKKSPVYHMKATLSTFTAWFCKFSLMVCLIYGIIRTVPVNLENSALIYGRYETMFAITAFSPTPGGSGLAEYLFGGFYSDFVPVTLAVVIAFIWRLISYYSYLFIGVVVVPTWIRKVMKRSKQNKINDGIMT